MDVGYLLAAIFRGLHLRAVSGGESVEQRVEALESRVLFSGGINTSTIGLFNAGGGPTAINPNQNVWLLFHGLNMSKDNMISMASGMQAARPNDQVVIVDWSVLASTGSPRRNADATAEYLTGVL